MKIVDLSKPIKYNKSDPWFMKVKIKHKPHRKARWLIRFLGLPFKLFPKGFEGWADDTIKKMGVHSTTHIDAPWHYSPVTNGKKSRTIDEIPLEWCYGDGLVVDMKHKADFDPVTIEDIKEFLKENKLEIKPGMIVLITWALATPFLIKRTYKHVLYYNEIGDVNVTENVGGAIQVKLQLKKGKIRMIHLGRNRKNVNLFIKQINTHHLSKVYQPMTA